MFETAARLKKPTASVLSALSLKDWRYHGTIKCLAWKVHPVGCACFEGLDRPWPFKMSSGMKSARRALSTWLLTSGKKSIGVAHSAVAPCWFHAFPDATPDRRGKHDKQVRQSLCRYRLALHSVRCRSILEAPCHLSHQVLSVSFAPTRYSVISTLQEHHTVRKAVGNYTP